MWPRISRDLVSHLFETSVSTETLFFSSSSLSEDSLVSCLSYVQAICILYKVWSQKLKPLTGWITTNCGIFLMKWEYQTTLPASWETCMQVKRQHLEPDLDNRPVQNWERSTSTLICHPAYLAYMQSTSCKMPSWIKHRLESRLLGEI